MNAMLPLPPTAAFRLESAAAEVRRLTWKGLNPNTEVEPRMDPDKHG
jgi:hypothetical protein